MDDPFDPEDVIGHSSCTGSTVAGLLNSLEPPPELTKPMMQLKDHKIEPLEINTAQ
jgi:hypothetical protein